MSKPEFQYLKEICNNIEERVLEHENKISEWNDWNYEAVFSPKKFQTALENIYAYGLSDYWCQNFTDWFGILTAWPWDQLMYNPKYMHDGHKLDDEPDIWEVLLKYHYVLGKDLVVRFRYNKKSPLDKWLHRYANADASGWNVTTNVSTLLNVAVRYLFDKKTEDFFEIVEVEQDKEEEDEFLFD